MTFEEWKADYYKSQGWKLPTVRYKGPKCSDRQAWKAGYFEGMIRASLIVAEADWNRTDGKVCCDDIVNAIFKESEG